MKHEAEDSSFEPDWEIPLTVTVTAASVIDTVFATAFSVHTGAESCVNSELAVADIVAPDDNGGNFSRYIEQEYADDSDPEAMWHDWTVELKVGETFVVGHWWARTSGSPADWEWCAREAEQAFQQASLFVGKRVVEVYGARSNLSHFASWDLIAQKDDVTIPPMSTVIPTGLEWNDVPETGHYCLLVRWCPDGGCTQLTLPGGIDRAVRYSNDLIWKNVTIVETTSYNKSLDFFIEQDDNDTVNLVVEIASLGPAEIGELGAMILRLGGNLETLRALQQEPTSRYYDVECSSKECQV